MLAWYLSSVTILGLHLACLTLRLYIYKKIVIKGQRYDWVVVHKKVELEQKGSELLVEGHEKTEWNCSFRIVVSAIQKVCGFKLIWLFRSQSSIW